MTDRRHRLYHTIGVALALLSYAQAVRAQTPSPAALTAKLSATVSGSSVSLTLSVTNPLPPSAPAVSISSQASLVYTDPTTQAVVTVPSNVCTITKPGVNSLVTLPPFTLGTFPASLVYQPMPGDTTAVNWDNAHASYTLSGNLPSVDGGGNVGKGFTFSFAAPVVQVGTASMQQAGH